MARYSIKAPDGNTYQIDGPDGASDDQVRAEVLKQHPNAGGSAAPQDKPATLLSTLGRAAVNLPGDIAKTYQGIADLPMNVDEAILHPVRTAQGVVDAAKGASAVVGGALQHVRELSPADQQGSAPAMDKVPFDQALAAAKQKYFTKQGIYKEVGDHPLGTALGVASVAAPILKATGLGAKIAEGASAVGDSLAASASPVASKVGDVMTAGSRADAAASTMRQQIQDRVAARQAQAETEAAGQSDYQQRLSALSDRYKARSQTLADRAAVPAPAIGEAKNLSELGDSVRAPALAREAEINDAMRAKDTELRQTMNDIAAERESKGVGVSDTPAAKILVQKSKALVQPDPVNRPSVGFEPMDSAGGKLHSMLIDTLSPQEVPLSVDQAKQALQQGQKVNTAADGSFTKTVKPSLENVEELRRYVGEVLNGNVEGFGGINKAQARQMYGNLQNVIDGYVNGASAPLQANWRAGKQALEGFEKVRTGQALVGAQKGTDIASVPAANIPGRIVSGGRDAVKQAAAVAGDAPVESMLRSQVQTALSGAKTADQAAALVGPKSKLGDAISGHDGLTSAVQDYIQQLRTGEGNSARADTAATRAANFDKMATQLGGQSAKSTASAAGYQRDLMQLQHLPAEEVGPKYVDMLGRAHADGLVSDAEYSQGVQHAAAAAKAFKTKATRDQWLKGLAIGSASVVGAGGAYKAGSHAFSVFGG